MDTEESHLESVVNGTITQEPRPIYKPCLQTTCIFCLFQEQELIKFKLRYSEYSLMTGTVD